MGRKRTRLKAVNYANGKRLKWIYEVFYRERGDVEAEYQRTTIMDCQSRDEVFAAFHRDQRFDGMMMASYRRLRRMVPEDVVVNEPKKKKREKLESPACE